MVCDRCIMAVKSIFISHGITPCCIGLGYVEVKGQLDPAQLDKLEESLHEIGLDIIHDKKDQIVNKIKTHIVETFNKTNEPNGIQLSKEITNLINKDYKSISSLFTEKEGVTIEKYFINQRIEKVKELLTYDLLSLSQIADQLGFSSVAHLSAQFKQVTKMTPSAYKRSIGHRESLDNIE